MLISSIYWHKNLSSFMLQCSIVLFMYGYYNVKTQFVGNAAKIVRILS